MREPGKSSRDARGGKRAGVGGGGARGPGGGWTANDGRPCPARYPGPRGPRRACEKWKAGAAASRSALSYRGDAEASGCSPRAGPEDFLPSGGRKGTDGRYSSNCPWKLTYEQHRR
uniref:Uncharacterized protein n=1 Tax=Mustela putorius furo TaxID=9669 RepID=M3XS91_MUSPF